MMTISLHTQIISHLSCPVFTLWINRGLGKVVSLEFYLMQVGRFSFNEVAGKRRGGGGIKITSAKLKENFKSFLLIFFPNLSDYLSLHLFHGS